MTYVRAVDPPLEPPFHTTGFVEVAGARRPARATGCWADVWGRQLRESALAAVRQRNAALAYQAGG